MTCPKFLLLFLCSLHFLYGELLLKERFAGSEPGQYIALQQERTILLLFIGGREGKSVVLHEISLPKSSLDAFHEGMPFPWQQFLDKRAPGATSWIRYLVNVENGQFEEAWCCLRACHLDVRGMQGFLSTLLHLPWVEVPLRERKRMGVMTDIGPEDTREVWNPKLRYNGNLITPAFFDSWRARWPEDGTTLAGLKIEIYLPARQMCHLKLPGYLPYWMEAKGRVTSIKMRAIDAGNDLVLQ